MKKPKIIKINDIDGIILFGKYSGYSLSELFKTWDGRNYMIFIIKNFTDTDITDFVSNYLNIMYTPLNFFEYFNNTQIYHWDREE